MIRSLVIYVDFKLSLVGFKINAFDVLSGRSSQTGFRADIVSIVEGTRGRSTQCLAPVLL